MAVLGYRSLLKTPGPWCSHWQNGDMDTSQLPVLKRVVSMTRLHLSSIRRHSKTAVKRAGPPLACTELLHTIKLLSTGAHPGHSGFGLCNLYLIRINVTSFLIAPSHNLYERHNKAGNPNHYVYS